MSLVYEKPDGQSTEWYTPSSIYDMLGIKFDLDPCSPGKKVVSWSTCKKHFTSRQNGLEREWFGTVFMNPPYSRSIINDWVDKFVDHGDGVALLFARTSTRWFHKMATYCDAVCFLSSRVPFIQDCDVEDYVAGRRINRRSGTGCDSLLFSIGCKGTRALLRMHKNKFGKTVLFRG